MRRVVGACCAAALLLVSGCAASGDPAPPPTPPDLGAAHVQRGVVFADRPSGALRLDLFQPYRVDAPRPVVVYVHGGGWESGTRQLDGAVAASGAPQFEVAQRLVRNGIAVAAVDYRLGAGAGIPEQVADVREAVGWLRATAHRWDIDPNRIVLWGGSSGGHLAAMLGVSDDLRPKGVRAVVNWFGPTRLRLDSRASSGGYARRVVARALGCDPAACPERAERWSPVDHVSGEEPTFLLQHGMADTVVPVEQSLAFAAELRRHGVPVEMRPYREVGHGFGHSPRTEEIVRTAVAFIRAHA